MIFRILINVNVGELTENKINKLQGILSKYFPSGISSLNQLISTGVNEQISITMNSIDYINNEGKSNNISNILSEIYDLLMLDNYINSCNLVLTDVTEEKYSMNYIEEKYGKLTDDSLGLGLRSFFNFRNSLCEFKIEPYLKNSKQIYIEGIYNLSNIEIKDLDSVIELIKVDYNNKKDCLKIL